MISIHMLIHNIHASLINSYYQIATLISPKLNTELRYKQVYRRKIDLKNPKTFSEKLLWLKLYDYNNNPLVAQCADKFRVREYVKKCGYEDILNELIGVYSSVDEIPWDQLPNQFVLKWNFGAGMNIVCTDKKNANVRDMSKQLRRWGKNKYWLTHSEMQYKNIEKKIICEKYLSDGIHSVIPDYKVYCFDGDAKCIMVMNDRGVGLKVDFYDPNWTHLESKGEKYKHNTAMISPPTCLSYMMECSRKLSEPFKFVRCDFYVVGDQLYFGELTFTPAGGLYTSEAIIDGKEMADYITI